MALGRCGIHSKGSVLHLFLKYFHQQICRTINPLGNKNWLIRIRHQHWFMYFGLFNWIFIVLNYIIGLNSIELLSFDIMYFADGIVCRTSLRTCIRVYIYCQVHVMIILMTYIQRYSYTKCQCLVHKTIAFRHICAYLNKSQKTIVMWDIFLIKVLYFLSWCCQTAFNGSLIICKKYSTYLCWHYQRPCVVQSNIHQNM